MPIPEPDSTPAWDCRGQVVHRSAGAGPLIEVVDSDQTRALHFGTPARQSCMWLAHPDRLQLPYTQAMMGFVLLLAQPPRRVLLLGLGGGSMAKFLLRAFPECRVDAVEQSARVVEVAHTFFALPRTSRLQVHVTDAQHFMTTQADQTYDAVLVDTFDAAGAAHCMVQPGFIRDCRRALTCTGVLALNLWRGADTGCDRTLALLADCFDARPLRLRVARRGNLIALAPRNPEASSPLPGFDAQACIRAADLALDLKPYAQQLQRQRRWWGRLLP